MTATSVARSARVRLRERRSAGGRRSPRIIPHAPWPRRREPSPRQRRGAVRPAGRKSSRAVDRRSWRPRSDGRVPARRGGTARLRRLSRTRSRGSHPRFSRASPRWADSASDSTPQWVYSGSDAESRDPIAHGIKANRGGLLWSLKPGPGRRYREASAADLARGRPPRSVRTDGRAEAGEIVREGRRGRRRNEPDRHRNRRYASARRFDTTPLCSSS